MAPREPTDEECANVERILTRKSARFTGEKIQWWANYVKMYEDLVVQNGWDIFEETYWVEFLTFRLEGEARKIFENWTLEDPSIRGDYQKVKKSFPGKFGVEDNVWKRMSDYELCRMKPDETISDNV